MINNTNKDCKPNSNLLKLASAKELFTENDSFTHPAEERHSSHKCIRFTSLTRAGDLQPVSNFEWHQLWLSCQNSQKIRFLISSHKNMASKNSLSKWVIWKNHLKWVIFSKWFFSTHWVIFWWFESKQYFKLRWISVFRTCFKNV